MTRDLWIVVPVKPLRDSKTRLAGVLDGPARRALVRRLLSHTLQTVQRARRIAGCLVISRDPAALHLARSHGALAVHERQAGLNSALGQAATLLRRHGAAAMLVLPLDLPLIDLAAVSAMSQRHRRRAAAIAPDRRGKGTNALLLQPVDLIDCSFGPDSFADHVAALHKAGVAPRIVKRPGLALDIDTPADLAQWGR
jgi:2-phospho-L-lactate guanylyltransferase